MLIFALHNHVADYWNRTTVIKGLGIVNKYYQKHIEAVYAWISLAFYALWEQELR